MAIVTEHENKEFKQPNAGTHTGRLYKMIDLGTQQGEYMGAPTYPARQIFMQWELPEELMEDGRPLTQGAFVNLMVGEKSTLRKIVVASLGFIPEKGFDTLKLMGTTCNLQITHEQKVDKVKVKIQGWTPLKKNEHAPVQINPSQLFDLDNFSQVEFDALPDYFKKKVESSPEYQNRGKSITVRPLSENPAYGMEELDEEIPF